MNENDYVRLGAFHTLDLEGQSSLSQPIVIECLNAEVEVQPTGISG